MQENEFEKQMRQKMEELRLDPSSAVWENIELKIKNEKQRRRAFILLPLVLICLLLSGYFVWRTSVNTKQNKRQVVENAVTKESGFNNSPERLNTEQNIKKEKKVTNLLIAQKKVNSSNILPQKTNVRLYKSTAFRSTTKPKSNIIINEANATDIAGKQPEKKPAENNPVSEKINTGEEYKSGKEDVPAPYNSSINPLHDTIKTQITDHLILNNKEAVTKKNKKTWAWGLTFSVGVSSVADKFLATEDKTFSQDYLNTGGGIILHQPSKIKSSMALTTGFFIQKNISKKTSIKGGLNYKFYSTTNKTGADSINYYRSQNSTNNYPNYFHHIELPLSLQVKIGNALIPVFLDAGVSISRLIGSNALQFNNVNGLYYHDFSLFNKTQVGLSTGLSVALFAKQKTFLLISPQINYNVTKIASKGLYANKHFTLAELKTQIIFGKK